MSFTKNRVLVTGGAGFIGSNLIEKLLLLDNEVVCFDNFLTGKFENIKEFIDDKRFKLVVGDLRSYNDCLKAIDGVDYVLHEGALGSVPRSINDPITTNSVNVNGFLNMLYAAKETKIKRFIYAASSSTYGDSQNLPKVEDIIGRPLSPYAVTKYVNELYAEVFTKEYGIETIGLRYFNVFGKKQDPNGAYAAVIPLFIKQLIQHKTLIINGDGEYSRDFTYIDNVVQMNLLALSSKNQDSINQIYNTAFGEKTTLNQLVIYLKQFLSEFDPLISKAEVKNVSIRNGDIPHSLADISKAKKLLGYNPIYNLEKGLKESINWYWDYFNMCKHL